MRRRQCPQQIFGLGRQVQHEFAAIALGGFAGQQSQSRKPLHQLRYGVRPQNQALREIADGGFAARYAAYREQRLMLPGGEAGLGGFAFAEREKNADRRTEIGQRRIIGVIERGRIFAHRAKRD